jgi:hypothetical protein
LLLPLLPAFTPYRPGNGQAFPLIEHILSFSISWLVAVSLFLVGFKLPLFTSGDPSHLNLSASDMVNILVGSVVGGAFAGAVGYGLPYSPLVDFMLSLLDLQTSLPEPFVSIGFIFGIAIIAGLAFSFTTISEKLPMSSPLALVFQFSISALIGRIVVAMLSAIFLAGHLLSAILLTDIIGGFVCGALAWYLSIGHKAA